MKIRNGLLLKLSILALLIKSFPAIAQSIEFTQLPLPGSGGYAHGVVKDVDHSQYGVALFIDVFGSKWTKPTFANPITPIQADNTFAGNIVTGGQDACAQTVFGYVVPLDIDPNSIQASGQGSLPSALDQVSIAHVSALRSSVVTLMFAGRVWQVKVTGDCVWAPGPNRFSSDNAWVDAQGRMHLKVSYVNGAWRCAEIILNESLGYGTYTFYVEGDFEHFPDPIVAGWFTYSDDAEYAHREIDVEHSNGDVIGRPDTWQYVIQPYNAPGQRVRFSAPGNTSQMIHAFTWIPNSVAFASFATNQVKTGLTMDYFIESADTVDFKLGVQTVQLLTVSSSTNIVVSSGPMTSSAKFYRARLAGISAAGDPLPFQSGTIENGVPPSGNEKVHMNLWLFNGISPGTTDQTYEIIVGKFEFEPLKRVRLGVTSISNNELTLSVEYPGE